MKQYLTKFSTRAEYTAALENLDFPNVTYLSEEDEMVFSQVKPEPETDWSKEYLTFLALEDGTFTFSKNTIEYSLDGGQAWTELAANTPTPTVTAGSKIMFKATETSGGIKFSSTGKYEAMGNAYSMLFGNDFAEVSDLSDYDSVLSGAFKDNTNLISAKNLSLPATTLCDNCYSEMFSGCDSLTDAPELPATTLAEGCYDSMFSGCTALATAPALPATTLAKQCYASMFDGCTSLTTAPALPATTLADGCYSGMLGGCTSLTEAPALPATTLAEGCYDFMFMDCTSLATAPALPATTLAEGCYSQMFFNCTSLNYIKMLANDVSATNCLNNWVDRVSSSGTFVKHPNATLPSGVSGIPEGWTVETATA